MHLLKFTNHKQKSKMPNYSNLDRIAKQVKRYKADLLIVTKQQTTPTIAELYELGYRHFGENRVQDLMAKKKDLPPDICWHFIGNLQTNKVKYIARFIHLIHSVSNLKLIKEINKQGQKCKRRVPCLLELHIAKEKSKQGFKLQDIQDIMMGLALEDLDFIDLKGFMVMATNTQDEELIRREFRTVYQIFSNFPTLPILSMGMSQDYHLALEEGSTLVRLGRIVFKS